MDAVTESWRRRDELPSLYGRFDLRYDGTGPAKLLEYNADTPTSLVEAASPQWFWMEERFPGADQWNSLHERLIDAWKKQSALLPPGSPLYFAHTAGDESGEDLMTVAYLKETAEQAGLRPTGCPWRRSAGTASPAASSTTACASSAASSSCTRGSG